MEAQGHPKDNSKSAVDAQFSSDFTRDGTHVEDLSILPIREHGQALDSQNRSTRIPITLNSSIRSYSSLRQRSTSSRHHSVVDKQHDNDTTKPGSSPKRDGGSSKLGTFSGVFVPTTLNVLSILMFIRFGMILGQGGLVVRSSTSL
jgi:hypothetical protein